MLQNKNKLKFPSINPKITYIKSLKSFSHIFILYMYELDWLNLIDRFSCL